MYILHTFFIIIMLENAVHCINYIMWQAIGLRCDWFLNNNYLDADLFPEF